MIRYLYHYKNMRPLTHIFRFLVGALFIFSGFIKANDPIGFGYKMHEYFEVFHLNFLVPASLYIAIFMCVLEMILGFMLLVGSRSHFTVWMLFLLIVFFGFLTFYSAYFDVVKTCGCFGDCIPLTPWKSFGKDMILLVMVLFLFWKRDLIRPLFGKKTERILVTGFSVLCIVFPIYTYNYLPVKDCSAFKTGTNLWKAKNPKMKYFYSLKDKKTGKVTEFDHWPDKWDSLYDYVSNRHELVERNTDTSGVISSFMIQDSTGLELTNIFLADTNYSFILVEWNLDETNRKVQPKINDFAQLCRQNNISFIGLTSTQPYETVKKFMQDEKPSYSMCICPDDVPTKAMVRSNPGLVMLKNGAVIKKWHYHSFPAFDEMKNKYFPKK